MQGHQWWSPAFRERKHAKLPSAAAYFEEVLSRTTNARTPLPNVRYLASVPEMRPVLPEMYENYHEDVDAPEPVGIFEEPETDEFTLYVNVVPSALRGTATELPFLLQTPAPIRTLDEAIALAMEVTTFGQFVEMSVAGTAGDRESVHMLLVIERHEKDTAEDAYLFSARSLLRINFCCVRSVLTLSYREALRYALAWKPELTQIFVVKLDHTISRELLRYGGWLRGFSHTQAEIRAGYDALLDARNDFLRIVHDAGIEIHPVEHHGCVVRFTWRTHHHVMFTWLSLEAYAAELHVGRLVERDVTLGIPWMKRLHKDSDDFTAVYLVPYNKRKNPMDEGIHCTLGMLREITCNIQSAYNTIYSLAADEQLHSHEQNAIANRQRG